MTAFHPLATFLPSGGNNEAGQLETSIRIVECLLSLFPCQKRPVRVRPQVGRPSRACRSPLTAQSCRGGCWKSAWCYFL